MIYRTAADPATGKTSGGFHGGICKSAAHRCIEACFQLPRLVSQINYISTCRQIGINQDAHQHVSNCCSCRRSLVACACVCRNWLEAAHEDRLWLNHLEHEYFRPILVAYSAAHLPAGWQDPSLAASTAAAAAGVSVMGLLQPFNESCSSTSLTVEQRHLQDSSRAPHLLKNLFAAGRVSGRINGDVDHTRRCC